jgi:cell division septal protein FtsQ
VEDDRKRSGLTGSGVERRNLQALIVAGVLTAGVAAIGWGATRLSWMGVKGVCRVLGY